MRQASRRTHRRQVWQLPGWPGLTVDMAAVTPALLEASRAISRLHGRMELLDGSARDEALLVTLTDNAVLSSAIEGEVLRVDSVRSSLANRLGIETGVKVSANQKEEGVVQMTLDATRGAAKPLTAMRLFTWHAWLFPTGHSDGKPIKVGGWRPASSDPMRVVSGDINNPRVHFTAPPATQVPAMMRDWLTGCADTKRHDPYVHAALAHLWFLTVHPLDDGNGRVARAATDLLLARVEQGAGRYFSLSAQIRKERSCYYEELEAAQGGTLDATRWCVWFLSCLGRAASASNEVVERVIARARFWGRPETTQVNPRQRKALTRLLDGFVGDMTTGKYANLTKCSQDTASRDLGELARLGLVSPNGKKGRTAGYRIRLA
jgi:Fic family protein